MKKQHCKLLFATLLALLSSGSVLAQDAQLVDAAKKEGGKVVVYTGILPVCANDAGLATVMGHEIAHALARHGSERMAQQQLVKLGQR